jgi:hypothetical protein
LAGPVSCFCEALEHGEGCAVLLLLYLSGVFEHARTVFVEMPDWMYNAALALFLDKGGD